MAGKLKDTIRTSVLLPRDACTRIGELAAANDVSAAWIMRRAILKFLDDHEASRELPLRPAAARTERVS